MKSSLTRADALIAGGAVVTLLFSFFGFFEFANAWSTSGFAFISTIPALMALLTIGWYGCEAAGVNLPSQLLTFTPPQIKVVLSTVALLNMLAWITVDVSKDALFWIQVLGTIAMTAGSVAAIKGKLSELLMGESDGATVAVPPPPGAPAPQASYSPQLSGTTAASAPAPPPPAASAPSTTPPPPSSQQPPDDPPPFGEATNN